jgi:hypothetical protein
MQPWSKPDGRTFRLGLCWFNVGRQWHRVHRRSQLGMRLFGLHTFFSRPLRACNNGYFSARVSLERFWDQRCRCNSFFTSLTVMLLAPLTWHRDYMLNKAIASVIFRW